MKVDISRLSYNEKAMLAGAFTSLECATSARIMQFFNREAEDALTGLSRSFFGFFLKGPFDLASSIRRDRKVQREIDRQYNVKKNTALLKKLGMKV